MLSLGQLLSLSRRSFILVQSISTLHQVVLCLKLWHRWRANSHWRSQLIFTCWWFIRSLQHFRPWNLTLYRLDIIIHPYWWIHSSRLTFNCWLCFNHTFAYSQLRLLDIILEIWHFRTYFTLITSTYRLLQIALTNRWPLFHPTWSLSLCLILHHSSCNKRYFWPLLGILWFLHTVIDFRWLHWGFRVSEVVTRMFKRLVFVEHIVHRWVHCGSVHLALCLLL